MTERDEQTRKGIRRTALILAALAIALYVGFILSGVIRS
jgi:hypothetical protein